MQGSNGFIPLDQCTPQVHTPQSFPDLFSGNNWGLESFTCYCTWFNIHKTLCFLQPWCCPKTDVFWQILSLHKTSQGITNVPMHHDCFAEAAFLSCCILSCHCSSCQKANVAGKAFYTDSLERTFQCMLQHLNAASFASDLIDEIGNKSVCR